MTKRGTCTSSWVERHIVHIHPSSMHLSLWLLVAKRGSTITLMLAISVQWLKVRGHFWFLSSFVNYTTPQSLCNAKKIRNVKQRWLKLIYKLILNTSICIIKFLDRAFKSTLTPPPIYRKRTSIFIVSTLISPNYCHTASNTYWNSRDWLDNDTYFPECEKCSQANTVYKL